VKTEVEAVANSPQRRLGAQPAAARPAPATRAPLIDEEEARRALAGPGIGLQIAAVVAVLPPLVLLATAIAAILARILS
jgi:hypothetical protein